MHGVAPSASDLGSCGVVSRAALGWHQCFVVGGQESKPLHLDEHDYNYLVQAYRAGVVPLGSMRRWFELCFDSNMPEWFQADLMRAKQGLVWRDLNVLLDNPPRFTTLYGSVQHDANNIVGHHPLVLALVNPPREGCPLPTVSFQKPDGSWQPTRVTVMPSSSPCDAPSLRAILRGLESWEVAAEGDLRTKVAEHFKVRPAAIAAVIPAAASTCPTTHQSQPNHSEVPHFVIHDCYRLSPSERTLRWLHMAFPSSHRELELRQHIDVKSMFRSLCSSRVLRPHHIVTTIRACRGLGSQALVNILVAQTVEPRLGEVLRTAMLRGFMSHGLGYYIQLMKLVHERLRNSAIPA